MVSREDLMDDEDHLLAQDMLYAQDLADRFLERDTRELAERAAADRDWTYRHVVVDEAQELSEMDWRVLMRRCPGRSSRWWAISPNAGRWPERRRGTR